MLSELGAQERLTVEPVVPPTVTPSGVLGAVVSAVAFPSRTSSQSPLPSEFGPGVVNCCEPLPGANGEPVTGANVLLVGSNQRAVTLPASAFRFTVIVRAVGT